MPMASLARRPTVLIVLHQEHSTPGRIGAALRAMGVEARHPPAEPRRPAAGDARRITTASSCSAARWAPTTRSTGSDRRSTGSKRRSPRGNRRSGSASARKCWRARSARGCSATKTSAAKSAITRSSRRPRAIGCATAKFPRCVYQWHSDGFDLPEGAELLAAGGATFPNQAYRHGRHAVGLQFHPEVTYHMMCRWTHRGAERLTRPGALSRPEHLGGWFQPTAGWPPGSKRSCRPGSKGGCPTSSRRRARERANLNRAPDREEPAVRYAGV